MSVFGGFLVVILTEYGEILCISLDSVRIGENTDQKNTKYGHFPRTGYYCISELSIEHRISSNKHPGRLFNL